MLYLRMRFLVLLALALPPAVPRAAAAPNLVANGSFETWSSGLPSGWGRTVDPAAGVAASVSADTGRIGVSSVRINCTVFPAPGDVTPNSHADLYQENIPLTGGTGYKLTFWARGSGIEGQTVRVAFVDRSDWTYFPVWQYFSPGGAWQRFEFSMMLTRDISASHGLLWFTLDETGSVWLDDVQLVAEPPRYNPRIPAIGSKNMIPNSGFEAGPAGWGTLGKTTGWGGNPVGLYGEIDSSAPAWQGRGSLKIELGPGKTRDLYYDVWPAGHQPQDRVQAASLGWMEVNPGQPVTFSAYMRADRDNVPAVLTLRYGTDPSGGAMPGFRQSNVTIGTAWERYSFTTLVPVRDVFVAAGPDLSATPGAAATVWIDALQLEQGGGVTPYEPREPLEIGIDSRVFGNLFNLGEKPVFHLTVDNRTSMMQQTTVTLQLTDYFGASLPPEQLSLTVDAGAVLERTLSPPTPGKGFYRARFTWSANGREHEKTLRYAWLDPYQGDESPFGINHAPGAGELCQALLRAGVTWARDWSLVRGHIEPAEGQLDFSESDVQIQRMLDQRFSVLALVPLPSANWDSTAPPEVPVENWSRMSRMPVDTARLFEFIRNAMAHQAAQRPGKIKYWEFLNEPVWTSFCLPSPAYNLPGPGYAPADYINLLKQAYPVFKQADPGCVVLGGFSAEPWRYADDFINAGGLDYIDIFNLHNYGGLKAPETYIPEMEALLGKMDAAGKRPPIWMTEFSYYGADDRPWSPWVAPPDQWASGLLLADERQCADWSVRNNVIMLAHGVSKIFYHSGTFGEPNIGTWTLEFAMFDEQGQPRKLYAAQAVMANLFGPEPEYAAPLTRPGSINGKPTSGVFGYSFQCGGRAVMAVWAAETASTEWGLRVPEGVAIHDLMGNRVNALVARLGRSPAYFVSDGLDARQLAAAGTLVEWSRTDPDHGKTGLTLAWQQFN